MLKTSAGLMQVKVEAEVERVRCLALSSIEPWLKIFSQSDQPSSGKSLGCTDYVVNHAG